MLSEMRRASPQGDGLVQGLRALVRGGEPSWRRAACGVLDPSWDEEGGIWGTGYGALGICPREVRMSTLRVAWGEWRNKGTVRRYEVGGVPSMGHRHTEAPPAHKGHGGKSLYSELELFCKFKIFSKKKLCNNQFIGLTFQKRSRR